MAFFILECGFRTPLIALKRCHERYMRFRTAIFCYRRTEMAKWNVACAKNIYLKNISIVKIFWMMAIN